MTGTAQLAGTVEVVFKLQAYFRNNHTESILHATNISGKFSNLVLTDPPEGYAATLQYTATDVMLVMTRSTMRVTPRDAPGAGGGAAQAQSAGDSVAANGSAPTAPNANADVVARAGLAGAEAIPTLETAWMLMLAVLLATIGAWSLRSVRSARR